MAERPMPNPSNSDLVGEAKRLSEAATSGPWRVETDRSDQYHDMPGPDDCEFAWRIVPEGLEPGKNGIVNLVEEETTDADAEFIARARTLLPELAQQLEQAEQAITALVPFYRETRREVEELIRKMPPEAQDEYLTRFRRAEKALAALTPDEGAAQPDEEPKP